MYHSRSSRISWLFANSGSRRASGIPVQPFLDSIMVVLFAPEQAGERLPLHPPGILGHLCRAEPLIERIRLGPPRGEDGLGIRERPFLTAAGEAQFDALRAPRGDAEGVMGRRLGAH